MCKRLFCLTSVVLVLSLALAGPVDAELVAYWPFDEASGDVVYDSTGNGNNGTINGAEWGDGRYGPALSFNGIDNYVEVPSSVDLEIDGPVTIAAWINWIDSGDGWQTVMSKGPYSGPGENYAVFVNLGGRYFHFALAADGGRVTHNSPNGSVATNEWLHVCCTSDGSVARIYVNGEMVMEVAQTGGLVPTTLPLRIGHREGSSHYWNGMIDEVRIYNHALTEPEVLAAMEGAIGYPYAIGADPEDGEMVSATWLNLSWSPGSFAVSHDVYLGDNYDDVNDATVDSPVYRGKQTETYILAGFFGLPYPDGLVPGTTYYWRIDEVNDADPNSPWKGDVWSFWIPPYNAYEPSPSDGMSYVLPDTTLSWAPGFEAKLHYVHFGDNFDDVNDATGGAPATSTTFTPPALESGKTYYWRVDESNPPNPTVKGDVWSFTTMPIIPISDPNLIGWWKLDEATLAVDWSGHESHGTFRGDPQPELGYDGGALAFDGQDDYISVPIDVSETAYAAVLWFKTTNANCGLMAVVDSDLGGGGHDRHVYLTDGDIGIRLWSEEVIQTGGLGLADGLWHHLVYSYGASIGGQRVYVDGVLRASGSKNSSDFDWQSHVNIGFSNDAASDYFQGVMDDVRIYDKALTQADAQKLMRGDPTLAGLPKPSNGATADIFAANNLTWSPGENAAQHDVYFGTDRATVETADTSDTTGVYRGRQNMTSYTPPEGIQMKSGPFHWRVDEYNTDGTISTGRIWSFSVGDYGLVDDFESYNDIPQGEEGSNLVYVRYQDGFTTPNVNGSTIGYVTGESMEKANVHGGSQSVPFIFNNTTATMSEVTLNLTPAQDWTTHRIITLSLWFAGDGANVPGQFYIKINGVPVNYDGDASNLSRGAWQVWNIDLTAVPTNISNVTSFAFGIQGANANGTLLIDDIRLYAQPRELITPVQPGNVGLVAHYAFEGNANDSFGSNHGTLSGGSLFIAGKIGQAISLDGIDDFVSTGKFASELGIGGNNPRTITVWVYTRGFLNGGIYDVGNRSTGQDFCLRTLNGEDNRWRIQYWAGDYDFTYPTREKWTHFTHVHDGTNTKIFADGFLIVDWEKTINTTDDNPFQIGCYGWQNDYFNGMIDELRLYNRALTSEEAAGAAGITQPYDKPFED